MDGSKKKEKTKGLKKTKSPDLSMYSSDPSGSRKNEKEHFKKLSSVMEGTTSSDYTETSGGRSNEKGRFNNTSSLMEGAASSIYTDPSGSRSNEKGRYKNRLSFTEETSSIYTDASGNRSTEKGRYQNPSSFMEEPTSSVYTDASESKSSEKRRHKNPSSFMEEAISSAYTDVSMNRNNKQEQKNNPMSFAEGQYVYTVNMPEASFLTTENFISDIPSSDQNGRSTTSKVPRQHQPKENIRLMPFKVKDVMEMIKDHPTYRDKSPVMIKVKENDIDRIIEKQNYRIAEKPGSPTSLDQSVYESPVRLGRNLKDEADSFRISTGGESGKPASKSYKRSKESSQWPEKSFVEDPLVAGADRTQKIFEMPDVQAFPAVVRTGPGVKTKRRRRVTPTSRRRRVSKPRKVRSISRRRPGSVVEHVRPRSRRPIPRRRPVVRRPPYRRRYISPCTPYPMCEETCGRSPYWATAATGPGFNRPYYADDRIDEFNGIYNTPYYADDRVANDRVVTRSRSRVVTAPRRVVSDAVYYAEDNRARAYNTPYYAESRTSVRVRPHYVRSRRVISRANCCCNTCEERLQFIQPGLCNKKKNVWTNEYAIIPAPQVNLIDPCEELDPAIYPRADNPCLRDGQGNPLTDCIGRPLRSPIGKRFLKFSANGSVMDTSLRGNFWTGQPPLCVKCPMPSCSCGPDTTHNWWMSCGYPIMPNMNPFYKRVLAAETPTC